METAGETAACRVAAVGPEDREGLREATRLARMLVADGVEGSPDAGRVRDWPARLRQDAGAGLLMGFRGERAAGMVYSHREEPDVLVGVLVGVLPEHRNQGVATTLLRHLERTALERGPGRLRFKVGTRLTAMIRLSLLFGMEITGLERDEGSGQLRVILEKPLGRPLLSRPERHDVFFTVEGWPIKRACELEKIYMAAFGDVLDDGHPTLDEMILLDSTYENVLHVALVDGRPVGFKHAQERTRGLLHSHIGAVHPDFRGGGVAGALMKAQHEWAATQGYAGITTRSRNRYPHMLRLNLKHGFEIVGVVQALGELAIHLYKPLK